MVGTSSVFRSGALALSSFVLLSGSLGVAGAATSGAVPSVSIRPGASSSVPVSTGVAPTSVISASLPAGSVTTGVSAAAYAWGLTSVSSDVPRPVLLPAGTTALASGPAGFAALAGGQVWAGGAGSSELQPVALPGGAAAVSVDVGREFYLAADAAGRVFAWGDNTFGQLGNGTMVASEAPVEVALPAGRHVTSVAAGEHFAAAVTDQGAVFAWGSDSEGQLGDGRSTASARPVQVTLPDLGGDRVSRIVAGARHALALTTGGKVLAWGSNVVGQRATGTSSAAVVKLPGRAVSIAAGYGFSVAVLADGTAVAWGDNADGQLGIGSTRSASTPTRLKLGQRRLATVVAGDRFAVAITPEGSVLAWGDDSGGQLGDGAMLDRSEPVAVQLPTGVRIVAMATSSRSVLALAGQLPLARIVVTAVARGVDRPVSVTAVGFADDGVTLGPIDPKALQIEMVGGTCTAAGCVAKAAGTYQVQVRVVGTQVSAGVRVRVDAVSERTASAAPGTATRSAGAGGSTTRNTSGPAGSTTSAAPAAGQGAEAPGRSSGWRWTIVAAAILALAAAGGLIARRRRAGATRSEAPDHPTDGPGATPAATNKTPDALGKTPDSPNEKPDAAPAQQDPESDSDDDSQPTARDETTS